MSQDLNEQPAGAGREESPPDPACRFHRQRLHLHLEGELDPPARRFIAQHLEECAPCRREFERLGAERLRLLESMVEAPVLPARFAGKVIETIRRREEARARRAVLLRRRFAIGLAAGILIGSAAVALGLWTLNSLRQGSGGGAPAVAGSIPPPPPADGTIQESSRAAPVIAQEAEVPPAGEDLDHAPRPGPRAQNAAGFDLLEVLEKLTDSKGCTEDLNQDGAADFADAAFLFNNHYLSTVPVLASWSSQEILEFPDCSRWCEVHQRNL